MKKKLFFKFFVFAVIGALVTMTSCKDYDDDISGLETQVTAVKGDLTNLQSSVTTAQSAATAAQTSATDALAKANQALAAAQEAGDAEAIAALEEEVAGIMEDLAAINEKLEALAGLEAQIQALMAELEAANAEQLAAIVADVEAMKAEIQGMVGDMVTGVKLMNADTELSFSTIWEKENVFAKDIVNAITFVKDRQIQSTQSFVIQVSPVNAEITPEMVTLQNSKGVAYDNIEIVSVKPYNKLLTRSTDGSGLWEVTVRLKEYVKKDFDAATTVKENDITKKVRFAVAIDNTSSEENPLIRKVTTDYDITLKNVDTPEMNNTINYFVNEKNVSTIQNRYGKVDGVTEYTWKTSSVDFPTPSVAISKNKENVEDDTSDARQDKETYPAVQGQPIKIALTSNTSKIVEPENVRAIYVTLDKAYATESAPSEINAWNSYTYTGLNTVVEGTETTITIDGATSIDDVIGFRVYAVNVDGTLVDPDGKAFYVKVGKDATDWNALNTVVTASDATPANATNSASVNATLSKLDGATKYEWTTDKYEGGAEGAKAFDAVFTNADGTVFGTNGTGAITADFSKVTKVHTVATVNDWLAYKDNKVYNGKLVIKNASDHVLATLEVTFKKELPTAAPKGFSAKTSQIVNGIYNAYLIPTINGVDAYWTAPEASHGMMKLTNVFNFVDDAAGKEANFNFSFAASEEDTSTPVKLIAVDVNGNGSIVVAKKFIDNTTKHATTVSYNYGKISTETKNAAGTVIPYTVEVLNFETVYNNIYNSTYSWNWATRDQLHKVFPADGWNDKDTSGNFTKALPSKTVVYNTPTDFELGYIYGVSTHNPTEYNAPLSDSFGPNSLDIANATVKFVSNSNKVAEYFEASIAGTTVELTPKSGTTNPGAAVESTLEIKVKDMYGVEHTITIPFTVLKQ